jgi:hypothetical protein
VLFFVLQRNTHEPFQAHTQTMKIGNQIHILVMVTRFRASVRHSGAWRCYFNCKKMALVKSFPLQSEIARVTPSLPIGGRNPRGACPPDPRIRFFLRLRIYRNAPRGEGRKTPSARGSITTQYYRSQVFYRAKKILSDILNPPRGRPVRGGGVHHNWGYGGPSPHN